MLTLLEGDLLTEKIFRKKTRGTKTPKTPAEMRKAKKIARMRDKMRGEVERKMKAAHKKDPSKPKPDETAGEFKARKSQGARGAKDRMEKGRPGMKMVFGKWVKVEDCGPIGQEMFALLDD